MAGHAQLKFVMTECSKTQIRLTGLILSHTNGNKFSKIMYNCAFTRVYYAQMYWRYNSPLNCGCKIFTVRKIDLGGVKRRKGRLASSKTLVFVRISEN